jgi:NADH-quinone oxidoreductase subunit L
MLFNLRLIPLLPFVGAALLLLFGRSFRRQWVHLIACLSIAASCLVSLEAFFVYLPDAGPGGLSDDVWTWIASGDLKIDLALRMDRLSGLLCLVITFIGTLIHIYSTGYMSHEKDHARFFGYLNLFCGMMLVLVLGDSLPVMFIGWEGVGLCSYLLIGFWYTDKANADAGKKAFIVNRVGDFGFLLGMFLLYQATNSLDIPDIVAAAQAGGGALAQPFWFDQPLAFWAAVFLFIGAAGKSAQIPLYVWLPDAMAGPTPVSALIHAATMVTAGVYMVARLGAVYMVAPASLAVVALVGAATALFAALIGFAQNDFKKVLAYSTVSQLGFMFAGVGSGAFGAGVFHLYTHAFFKAGLFLCAGSVMHAMSGSGDITKMGGLRKKLPWTHAVFLVCWLAICGVPGFSGFFSKDAIVASAFGAHVYGDALAWVGPTVGTILLAAALCTAFYMSRLYFLVFTGQPRADAETWSHVHESPPEMVGPLVVLGAGAVLAGYVGLPPALGDLFGKADINLLGHWLEPVVGPEPHVSHSLEWGLMGASTVVAVIGILLARAFYAGGYREPARRFVEAVPGFVALVRDKFRVDELYDLIIVRPIKVFSVALFKVVDRLLIDKVLVHGFALVVDVGGRVSRLFQVGDVQRYLAVFAIGVVGIFYLAIKPAAPELAVRTEKRGDTTSVEVDASQGAPKGRELEYDFEFDGDGARDRTGRSPKAIWHYEGSATPVVHTIHVTIRDPRWGLFETTVEAKVRVK